MLRRNVDNISHRQLGTTSRFALLVHRDRRRNRLSRCVLDFFHACDKRSEFFRAAEILFCMKTAENPAWNTQTVKYFHFFLCFATPPSLAQSFLYFKLPLLCFIWKALSRWSCLGFCRDLLCLKQRLSLSQTQRRGRVDSRGGSSFEQILWGGKDLFKARCFYCFLCF